MAAPYTIKFGTDGWRAIIADKFTVENVKRLTLGTIAYMKAEKLPLSIALGYDCRFAGELFAEAVMDVCVSEGVEVYFHKGFITTPMLSLATMKHSCGLGIMLTASHNPPSYHGFKVKGAHGGPLGTEGLRKIEELVPDEVNTLTSEVKGEVRLCDFEADYIEVVQQGFNLSALTSSTVSVSYDAMYGSGQDVFQKILPQLKPFRCNYDPTFQGISPEPIAKNLTAYSDWVREQSSIDLALATDGDADRIGALDGEGNVLDSHHIMLFLLHYLVKYKKQKGIVVSGVSTTTRLKAYCDQFNMEYIEVPIGFKHISKYITERDDVLLGGEESGGIAVAGHIPERDGIWNGLLLLQLMVETGKTVAEMKQEIYAITGSFGYQRVDWKISPEEKERMLAKCQRGEFDKNIIGKPVVQTQFLDGFKYYLSDSSWVMIRPSGTEPVLRLYAEAASDQEAAAFIQELQEVLKG